MQQQQALEIGQPMEVQPKLPGEAEKETWAQPEEKEMVKFS
jgi:hypothetical protein